MKSIVNFIDLKLKKIYEKCRKSKKVEEKFLGKWIKRAIDDLTNNAFIGIQIPKRLIPNEYKRKYKITNLWKYNFPDGWRMLYTVKSNKAIVISVILEWLDHKRYERRFGY